MHNKGKKICFFAKVSDRELLEIMQWYRNDISILRELGYNVTVATNFSEIPWNCDLYFAWWPTTSIFPLIKSSIIDKPIIVVVGGSEVVSSEERIAGYYSKPLWARGIIQLCLKCATRILVVSKHLLKEALNLGIKDAFLVYHGIKTDEFKPSDKKKDILFTISHLNKENTNRKRLYTIIKSVPYVREVFPNQKFVIAGRYMDAFDGLKNEVDRLGLSGTVIFPGKISNREKLDYFSRCLIYLQPTIHEAFGVAIAEAMSCGIPVITSKVGAVPEVVKDCGIYTDPDDPRQLAENIIMLLRDKVLRSELGRKARQRIINNFSYERRKEKIKEIIEDLIGGNG